MKRALTVFVVIALIMAVVPSVSFAENTAVHGEISGKSIAAGLCSLLIWPGIGQLINEEETDKNITHAILGLTGIFRFWSGWDALIDREGGRWDGKI
ncbi:hypothetical protein ACFL3D_04435 [Candidatus Omnitrophota bacterium]